MFERVVSLLEGILNELKQLREAYVAAVSKWDPPETEQTQPAKTVAKPVEGQPNVVEFPQQAVTTKEVVEKAKQQLGQQPQAPAPTYEQCGQAFLKLATKDRDKALAVLKNFSPDGKIGKVKEEDYGKFFAAIAEASN